MARAPASWFSLLTLPEPLLPLLAMMGLLYLELNCRSLPRKPEMVRVTF
jgi:hypothetical protein